MDVFNVSAKEKVMIYGSTFGSVRMKNMPKMIRKTGYENGMKILLSEDFLSLDDENKNTVFMIMEDCVKNTRKGI